MSSIWLLDGGGRSQEKHQSHRHQIFSRASMNIIGNVSSCGSRSLGKSRHSRLDHVWSSKVEDVCLVNCFLMCSLLLFDCTGTHNCYSLYFCRSTHHRSQKVRLPVPAKRGLICLLFSCFPTLYTTFSFSADVSTCTPREGIREVCSSKQIETDIESLFSPNELFRTFRAQFIS